MKSLITGGAGFIGSHLCEELLRRGEEVYVIDDLLTGCIDNIEHLLKHPRFNYTIDTIMNEPLLAELIDRCNVVYHLAAAVGVKRILEEPVSTIEINIRGTEAVLRHAAKKRKPVILASTSEVYGKNGKVPYREDADMLLGPTSKRRWSYACSKAMDEFLALAYYKERRLPVTIIRFFNTVGERQTGRYGMVIPRFVQQALTGAPITVYGDGAQQRSFTYVKDVVRAVAALAHHPAAVGEIFNIGHYKEITITDLAKLIKEMTKSSSDIVYVPYDQAYEEGFEDMRRRLPDLTKVRQYVGYEPQFNLRQILECVIDYYRGRIAAEAAAPAHPFEAITMRPQAIGGPL